MASSSSLRVPRPSLERAESSHMGTRRQIICFSDFDGTIFMQDTGHILFDNFGCGVEGKKKLDAQITSGERSFRDVSDEMWGSLDVPFEDGFALMKDELEIDPDFEEFHLFCRNNSIPFHVISAGLKPLLRRVLEHFIGEEASSYTDIVANDATISADGSKWKPVWRHDTELGHDKAKSINEYREHATRNANSGSAPMIVFIGDGVSDLPAAREADVLFARRGLKLEEYCIENKLPYLPYDTFADIQHQVIKLAKLDDAATKGRGMPSNFNPRANVWRRMSSRGAIQTTKMRVPIDASTLAIPQMQSHLDNANRLRSQPVILAQPAA